MNSTEAYFIYSDDVTRKAVLHRADCNHVRTRKPDLRGDNRWLGPFTPLSRAALALKNTGKRLASVCRVCLPNLEADDVMPK